MIALNFSVLTVALSSSVLIVFIRSSRFDSETLRSPLSDLDSMSKLNNSVEMKSYLIDHYGLYCSCTVLASAINFIISLTLTSVYFLTRALM